MPRSICFYENCALKNNTNLQKIIFQEASRDLFETGIPLKIATLKLDCALESTRKLKKMLMPVSPPEILM